MIRSIDGKNSKAGFWYCLHEDLATFRIHLNRLVGFPSVYPKNTARRYSVRRADSYVCGSVGTLILHCTQGENPYLCNEYQAPSSLCM